MKIRYAPLAVACALMVAAAATTTAQAAAVTYSFGGTLYHVLDLPSLSVGDAYSGSFSYDTMAADANPDPGTGFYPNNFSITATVNGYSFSSSTSVLDCPDCGGITVSDQTGAGFVDSLSVMTSPLDGSGFAPVIGPQLNGFAPFTLGLYLDGPSTIYNSDGLPPTLMLSPFTGYQMFRFRFSNDGGGGNAVADGTITYLTLVTTAPVPEASTSAMLALGLGALAFVRRRKGR